MKEVTEEVLDLLLKLAASYHGRFEEISNEFYSTESVLCKLSKEEYDLLNKLFSD